MSIAAGPDAIEDSLVLSLDAGNYRSYPGSGNTWYDLSGNENHATKNGNVNNPLFQESSGLKYFNFQATAIGANGGFTINNSVSLQNLTAISVEFLVTLQTKTLVSGDLDWMCLMSKGTTTGTDQRPAVSINQGTGSWRYLHIETPTAFNSAANLFTDYTGDKWYHIVATMGTSSAGYLNASQVSSAALTTNTGTYPIYLGFDGDNEMFKGKMGIFKIYNKALTAAEIYQNFNAYRSRYGI